MWKRLVVAVDKKTYDIKKHDVNIKQVTKKMKSKKIKPKVQLFEYKPTYESVYIMECLHGTYVSTSWLGLGWEILKHRFWHLRNDGKWMD